MLVIKYNTYLIQIHAHTELWDKLDSNLGWLIKKKKNQKAYK